MKENRESKGEGIKVSEKGREKQYWRRWRRKMDKKRGEGIGGERKMGWEKQYYGGERIGVSERRGGRNDIR